MVLLAESEIPGYNITVLPVLPGDAYLDAKFPMPTNYEAANLRHLKVVQWLGRVKEGALDHVNWIFMVDDDTFVNLPMLLDAREKDPIVTVAAAGIHVGLPAVEFQVARAGISVGWRWHALHQDCFSTTGCQSLRAGV